MGLKKSTRHPGDWIYSWHNDKGNYCAEIYGEGSWEDPNHFDDLDLSNHCYYDSWGSLIGDGIYNLAKDYLKIGSEIFFIKPSFSYTDPLYEKIITLDVKYLEAESHKRGPMSEIQIMPYTIYKIINSENEKE